MDTISRESNTSFLPMAGIIAGALALILAVFALVKLNALNKAVGDVHTLTDRVTTLEGQTAQIGAAVQTANEVRNYTSTLAGQIQSSFQNVGTRFTQVEERLATVEKARVSAPAAARPAAATAGGQQQQAAAATAVAGSDTYTVKAGDIGAAIFRTTGFSQAQLEAVNPGIDWRKLKPGQKIVLPKK